MRILQLIDTLEAGGAERMAVNIANGLAQKEHASYLCATRRGGLLEGDLQLIEDYLILDKKGKFDIRSFLFFFKWLKKNQIELIHAHSTSIYLAILAKIRYRHLKIVWHDHYGLSDSLDKRPHRPLKICARYIDATIAVNEKLKSWAKEVLNLRKVHFLPNFARLSPSTKPVTQLFGEEGKRVVCLANLRPQKNHLILINEFEKCHAQHPEWTLHLVGQSFQDEYAQQIEDRIKAVHLENSVFLYGSCPDVKNVLHQATIGVLVSISEGLPIALLEYADAQLPVIVTDVGQCASVVGDRGVVIKSAHNLFSNALKQLYLHSQEEREAMGSRFRESVQQNYSEQAFFKKLLPIYSGLVS